MFPVIIIFTYYIDISVISMSIVMNIKIETSVTVIGRVNTAFFCKFSYNSKYKHGRRETNRRVGMRGHHKTRCMT